MTYISHKLNLLLLNNIKIILKFLAVGAFSAIIYFASFSFFWNIMRMSYPYAVSIAYILSVVCHFMGNRNITFRSIHSNKATQIIKYLIMVLTNYLLTLLIVFLIVNKLHFSPYLGIVVSIGTTIWTGFFMAKLWVFNQKTAISN